MAPIGRIESREVERGAARDRRMREYLSLELGDEAYGIDILRVPEIRGFEAPTRMAGVPLHVRGVLNLRGLIVPMVDLRVWFGLATASTERTVTIVLNIGGRTIGAVVDAVSDVVQEGASQIRPMPEFTTSADPGHITGVFTVRQGERERLLILLDIGRPLTGSDIGLCGPTRQQTLFLPSKPQGAIP